MPPRRRYAFQQAQKSRVEDRFALSLPQPQPPTTCPKCRAKNIPVYQLGVPTSYAGRVYGALHLAAHDCPKGGDHMRLQRKIDVDNLKARLRASG